MQLCLSSVNIDTHVGHLHHVTSLRLYIVTGCSYMILLILLNRCRMAESFRIESIRNLMALMLLMVLDSDRRWHIAAIVIKSTTTVTRMLSLYIVAPRAILLMLLVTILVTRLRYNCSSLLKIWVKLVLVWELVQVILRIRLCMVHIIRVSLSAIVCTLLRVTLLLHRTVSTILQRLDSLLLLLVLL